MKVIGASKVVPRPADKNHCADTAHACCGMALPPHPTQISF